MPAESSEVTTTIFVSNLHCGSCVQTIQDALSSLSPPPSSVDVSIVTQSVTVQHPRALSPETLKATIDEAGYDILTTPTTEGPSPTHPQLSWSARVSHMILPRQKRHLDNCAQ
ncbi:hypothetical protein C8T65DRAFT_522745, partial [Cerioporus squamosus]